MISATSAISAVLPTGAVTTPDFMRSTFSFAISAASEAPGPFQPIGELAKILNSRGLDCAQKREEAIGFLMKEIAEEGARSNELIRSSDPQSQQKGLLLMRALIEKGKFAMELKERGVEYIALRDFHRAPSLEAKTRALSALSGTKDPEALLLLTETGLRSMSKSILLASILALRGIDDEHVQMRIYQEGFRHSDIVISKAAAQVLSGINNLQVQMALTKTMLDVRQVQEVRELACDAVRGTTQAKVLRYICTKGIKHPRGEVREYAARALKGTKDIKTLKWLCRYGLPHKSGGIAGESAQALAGTDYPPAVVALVNIGLKQEFYTTRKASAQALAGNQSQIALRGLYEVGLKDETWEVREASAKALAGVKDTAAVMALLEGSGLWNSKLTNQAFRIFGTGSYNAMDVGVGNAKLDLINLDKTEVRVACIKALAGCTDGRVIKAIYDVGLKDDSSLIRKACVIALIGVKHPRARNALKQISQDGGEEFSIRQAALLSLDGSDAIY